MNHKLLLMKSYLFILIVAITFGCATKYGAHFQRTSEHNKRYQRADQENSASKSEVQSIRVNDPVKEEILNEPGYINGNDDQTGAVASINKDVISKSPITDHVKSYEKKVESIENKNLDTKTFRKEVKMARKELNKEIKNELKTELNKAKKDYRSYKKSVIEKDASAKVVNKWVYIGLVVGAGGLVLLIAGVGAIGGIALVVGVGFIVYGLLLNAGII